MRTDVLENLIRALHTEGKEQRETPNNLTNEMSK